MQTSQTLDPSANTLAKLTACPCCGLIQQVPARAGGLGASTLRCHRCNSALHRSHSNRSASRTAAIALAALLLYPLAVGLPMVQLERFGHVHQSSVWSGSLTMLAKGEWFVGSVVFFCSIVLPLVKLLALLGISVGVLRRRISQHHRAWVYRLIEITGRWGMVDVLLVAILVAAVKLGSLVQVHAGPGAVAFTACVLLSLVASAVFNPRAIWEDR
jgi:paraquat-inducible protein A